MKKTSLLILSILFVQLSFGQSNEKRFTIIGSPQISWMSTDNNLISKSSALFGYNFGLIFDNFLGENYALSTGVIVNGVGGKFKIKDEILKSEIVNTYKLKYLEIPVGLKLRSADFRQINIYGELGFSPQIRMSAVDILNNSLNKEIRLLDLSYYLGGGIEYSINSRNALLLGLRFNNGLVDITKDDTKDKTILNRISVNCGFIF